MVLPSFGGSCGGNGVSGSKLYVSESNLEEKEDYSTAKHLAFAIRLCRPNPSAAA